MRTLACILALLAMTVSAQAQERTLIGGADIHGGFGGPVLKYTRINDQDALMVGGRGGWILNHALVLGGGGYGVVNDIDAPPDALPFEPGPLDIEFGYGGFEMEYVIRPNDLVHFSFYTLFGGGANNFVKDVGNVTDSNEQAGETDFVLVIEPAVSAEMNVTTWFRLNLGVSYRLVTGVEQDQLDDSDFSGASAALTFKFGTF